ncbi:MAG: alpha/beta hydrolase [Bryobacterales bacterium]|nr:alpha/beta hydrolase [Bryobacterales bacterium]
MHRRKLFASVLLWAGLAQAQVMSDVRPNVPPAIPDSVVVDANIKYGGYAETVLDVYRPKAASKEKRPGVLVIHGGGWTNGTKEQRVEPVVLRWVSKGFVVANVEYRLAKAAIAPAAVVDVLKAAEWFEKNAKKYGADPRRIAVTGDSAGGHLALMVAMTPKTADLGRPAKVAAVVNFFGITDVADQLQGANERKYATTWIPEMPRRLDLARRVSPMTYVRKDVAPILTIHGDADPTVPYEHGVSLTKALRDAGADAALITVPQGKHGFPKAKTDELYEHVWEFLKSKKVM